MITEIIFIILTFLITGYGIYRFGREEKNIEHESDLNEDNNDHLNIDNEPLNNSINDEIINNNNINNNILNNSNNNINIQNNENTNNNINVFKKKVMQIIVMKEENNMIDWGDIETTANAIFQKLISYDQKMVQNPSAEIKKILNEEKLKKEEETGKKLLNGNRYDKKDLNSSNIPINNENIININNDFEEQVNEQIETNKKNINWKNLPGAAQEIYNCLDKDAKLELGALEKIEDILKEKKSIGEKEAAMKLLNRHKENINIKTLATFVSSDENIYQNTSEEIIYILLNEPNRQLSDGENIQLQAIQMELLEKIAEERQKKLEEEKLREEEEKLKEQEEEIKEKERLKNIEAKAKEAQGKIVDEPEEGNPDAATICFRYPDGEKIKNRRFLKSNKIQNLYDYIASLGEEIYFEENNEFSLWQSLPPKKYDNMENTLEEEGLFPNAVIQIREE